nr:hypothetical protein [Haloprofundus salinisoli]
MHTLGAALFDLDGTLCRQDQDGETIYYGAFERADIDPFGEPADLWAALDGPPHPGDQLGYLASGFTVVAARYGRQSANALTRAFSTSSITRGCRFSPEPRRRCGERGRRARSAS